MKLRGLILLSAALGSLLIWSQSVALQPGLAQDESKDAQVLRLNNRGVAWLDQLKFPQAVDEFRRLTQLAPAFVPGHVNLGIALFYDQKYEESVASLRKALQLDPDQIQAHYMLGILQRNRDQAEDALESFTKALQQAPADPTINYFIGNLYRSRREFDQAIEYLERCIELEPYNKSAYYALSQCLLRSGRRQEGRKRLQDFQRLDKLSGTSTIGLDYREQGRYAIAIDRIPERYWPGSTSDPEAERITVTFSEAPEWGLAFTHAGPGRVDFEIRSSADLAKAVSAFGSGLAVADFDGDGQEDLYFANTSDSGAPGALFRNNGKENGRELFEDVTRKAGLNRAAKTMAALWGDIDNDADPDLYLINAGPNILFRNNGDGTFTDITQISGTGDSSWGLSGAFVDSDHDGDLDLVVANYIDLKQAGGGTFPRGFKGADNLHYRNNGDGTFSDVGASSALAGGALKTIAVASNDFNDSRDIDLHLVNQGAAQQLFSNQRDGTFLDLAGKVGAARASNPEKPSGRAMAVGDVDGDTQLDLLVGAGGRVKALISQLAGPYRAVDIGAAPPHLRSLHLLDFDNDGDLDLFLTAAPGLGESGPSGLFLWENRQGRFSDVSRAKGLSNFTGRPFRDAAIADFDFDGDLDVVVSINGGAPLALRNEGGNQNNWISVQTRGTNSNKSGVGTKVELRSGDFHLRREVAAGDGSMSQSSGRVHFGLGRRTRVDYLRLRWPGGVLQSELAPAINRTITIDELDRKGTSCPILYVWNGERFEYVTDFLGGAAFGYLLGPGRYNTPDSDETIKLDRKKVGLKNGQVVLSLNNQLEEVIFFDNVELIAVDHPAQYDVFPDEKLLSGPPFDPFRILTAEAPRPPRSARGADGRDLLDSLAKADRIYAPLIEELPFKGYAKPWELILDLGPVAAEDALLLMDAWIDYADSSSNLAASQAGVALEPPRLQVRSRQGEWVTVLEQMGFPAGLPRTMTVDLSGLFLSDSRQVRILSNMRIHWDRIRVETKPQRRDFRLHRVDLGSASLDFFGFPEFSSPDGRRPNRYFYDRVSPTAPWKVHRGRYTRFGDVAPLLSSIDDRMVVTRSGDRIRVAFDVSELPPLPGGWVRDYMLWVDGFGKDMDVNSADSDTVEPLPFHGMGSVADPQGSDARKRQRDRRQWDTRPEADWIPPDDR